jgi:DNA-binding MarR family transcriptional regulator
MADEPIVRGAILQELWIAARYATDASDRMLRAAGVDPREYGSVSFIGTLQPVTRTRLAQAMGVRRETIRDGVARLIERGHVEERPNPHDGRSTLLVLTPAGQKIFDRGKPVFHEVLRALDRALGGTLHEHEDAVRRVRVAAQSMTDVPVEA